MDRFGCAVPAHRSAAVRCTCERLANVRAHSVRLFAGVRSFRTKRVGEEAKELEAKGDSQGEQPASFPRCLCGLAGRLKFDWCDAEYGKVLSMLGDRRFRAHCMDGKERICHIPGRFAKRMWIAVVRGAPVCDVPLSL
jgi:hypothetical protein